MQVNINLPLNSAINSASPVDDVEFHPVSFQVRENNDRAKLQIRLRKLQQESCRINTQGESLLNTVMDLRKWLKLVEKQNSEELEAEKLENLKKESLVISLRKALENCYERGSHLDKVAAYWSQFCD